MGNLESSVASICCLAVLGIKPACLQTYTFSYKEEMLRELSLLINSLGSLGAKICVLKYSDTAITFIVYREENLCKCLFNDKNREFLNGYGYPVESSLYDMLNHLKNRINITNGFPHEIGIFLGYPLEDVKGFIQQPNGHKYLGPWKVYENVEEKKAIFAMYKEITKEINKKISNCNSFQKIFS